MTCTWVRSRPWLVGAAALVVATQARAQSDPLPSWHDKEAKKAIVEFVKATTTPGNPKFVPVPERIATFDQDGTLWVEHPLYSQVMYILERVPAVVKAKPELANQEPFKTVLSGNRDAIAHLTDRRPGKIGRGHAHRHAGGPVPVRGEDLDGEGPRPALEEAVQRAHLPADAGGAASTCGPTATRHTS